MTSCFRLVRALQPDIKRQTGSPCESCVYFSRNLDPSYFSSTGSSKHSCGLDFQPDDDACIEMRTSNCSARKK